MSIRNHNRKRSRGEPSKDVQIMLMANTKFLLGERKKQRNEVEDLWTRRRKEADAAEVAGSLEWLIYSKQPVSLLLSWQLVEELRGESRKVVETIAKIGEVSKAVDVMSGARSPI